MNDKLVVKSGGSYMLMDEFLEVNAEKEMRAKMISNSPDDKRKVNLIGNAV